MTTFLRKLKRHPFPVVAWFDRVVALSFAFPTEVLRPLVPRPLLIDSYENYGFVTVAMVWTHGLRPAGFPAIFGQNFFLAGYRVFTRMVHHDGRRLRGLKILRSETDKSRMVFSGNLLTHYNYQKISVEESVSETEMRVVTTSRGRGVTLDVVLDTQTEPTTSIAGSPFPDLHTARRFAGPMPYTFDDEGDGNFVVIEGRREKWQPKPVAVKLWNVSMFDEPQFKGVTPILANAFKVEQLPYRWERGRVVRPMESAGDE